MGKKEAARQLVEEVGVRSLVEEFGLASFFEALTPAEREELVRLQNQATATRKRNER
jgi:hypothetical protein